ncbi:M23 family metallopeptidase [Zobellia laminariae]|uniref:M23 family metallopeptidase n=1 Tax=Zobellia laminariae TaxID=248906 RepID=UPI0012D8959E|nr:M23 family metallopeptidase [Zobellia laminariae]
MDRKSLKTTFIIKSIIFLIVSLILLGTLAFVKTKLRVYHIAKGDVVNIYADNGEDFPISVELSYELENFQSINENEIFIIPKKTTRILLTSFKKIDSSKKGIYNYSFKHYFGDVTNTTYDKKAVYSLPLPPTKSYLLGQGYNGAASHKGNSAYSLDFQMPEGTKVYAARDGIVVDAEDSNDKGCPKPECGKFQNHVIIFQKDGTFSGYAHLKQHSIQVQIGDSVVAGQFIAESGSTGYTTGPHLHYEVFMKRLTKEGIETISVPVQFRINTNGKVSVPKEGAFYKRRY